MAKTATEENTFDSLEKDFQEVRGCHLSLVLLYLVRPNATPGIDRAVW